MNGGVRPDIPCLRFGQLSITLPNGRVLLRDANLEIGGGEFVLLVGGSGSGKTTLLRLIAGLYEPTEGPIPHDGNIGFTRSDGSACHPRVGLVFQNLALFDELSAEDNVQFALDHGPQGLGATREMARQLLQKLGVPQDTPLSRLSGGERQRVAVARTLAQDPPILLFDEPTTGLDPARARDVAKLLADTHREFGKTVVVVTHDYRPFLPYRPRMVLLDSSRLTLRDIGVDELESTLEAQPPHDQESLALDSAGRSFWVENVRRWLEAPGTIVLTILLAAQGMVVGWRQRRWKARYLWHYLRMTMVGTTAVYVLLSGAMLGFVFTSFSFAQLPFADVTVPLLTEEFLAATGYATYRVVVPLMISVLLAGKCGAAIAADIGTRRLTHQFDALRSFGVEPLHYYYGNIALALLISSPLLTMLAFMANWYAALVAFLLSREEGTLAAFERNFMSTVWPITHVFPVGTAWAAVKVATSGLCIAAIAYVLGARRKDSSPAVGRDVGLTIFWATLAVLALHSVYSFVEF